MSEREKVISQEPSQISPGIGVHWNPRKKLTSTLSTISSTTPHFMSEREKAISREPSKISSGIRVHWNPRKKLTSTPSTILSTMPHFMSERKKSDISKTKPDIICNSGSLESSQKTDLNPVDDFINHAHAPFYEQERKSDISRTKQGIIWN